MEGADRAMTTREAVPEGLSVSESPKGHRVEHQQQSRGPPEP